MIAFAHISRTRNIGDRVCTPALYFPFLDAQVFHLRAEIPPCEAIIFGGGAIEFAMRGENGIQHTVQAKHRIAWGIGASQLATKRHPPVVQGLDLTGIREYGRTGGEYVPCVSCMSNLFDADYNIEHEAVLFVNYDKKLKEPHIPGLPKLYNDQELEETIAFIASGSTVVTNSYHGAYWATLLGRKVVCLPYYSKFYGFKYAPIMASEENWRDHVNDAISYPEALEDCRLRNIAFYNRVMDIIRT